jgi:hypothetical protein
MIMAKRFIDTNIFRKDFVRDLEAPYKLLWLYIINECDHAGLWDVEMDVAQARLKLPELTIENALNQFKGKIIVLQNGRKWFIPDFIEFQYGKLNPENRAHNSVIQILEKYELHKIKPLTSPLQGCKDKDKDKVKVKEKIKYPELSEFLQYGIENSNIDFKFSIEAKYEQWVDNGWKDGNGNAIKNWKTKLKSTLPHLKPFTPNKDEPQRTTNFLPL